MPKIMKNGIEYGGGWEVYSETETKIGTFLGKDLYRKVIKKDLTPVQDGTNYKYDFTCDMGTIGYVTKIDGVVNRSTSGQKFTLSEMMALAYYQTDGTVFTIRSTFGGNDYKLKALIVEYTKEKWN